MFAITARDTPLGFSQQEPLNLRQVIKTQGQDSIFLLQWHLARAGATLGEGEVAVLWGAAASSYPLV
jgi:hypothetical protein